ncbi:MAG: DedA family protein [Chloroflexota bacterium]
MKVLTAIPAAVLGLYAAHELRGLFLFILLEEAGLPLLLPGDTLIIAAARKVLTPADAVLVILVAALAATIGSSLLYAALRRGGRPLLDRFRRLLHLSDKRITRMEGWFRRHGAVAIVLGRLIPGVRLPTTVMAGLFSVPYRVFAPATAVAALLWSSLYFLVGLLLRREWRAIVEAVTDIDEATAIVVGVVLLALLGGAITWRWGKRRAVENGRRQTPSPPGPA